MCFLLITEGPVSMYSCLVTHLDWKVVREARIDPPIHTDNFLYDDATTFNFVVTGSRSVSYLSSL